MSLLINHLLAVNVDDCQSVFLDVTGTTDTYGGQGDLFLLFNILFLLHQLFKDSLMVLSVIQFDPMRKLSHIHLVLSLFDAIVLLFFFFQVLLMHPFQLVRLLFFLGFFGFLIGLVGLHLTSKQLLSLDPFKLIEVNFI